MNVVAALLVSGRAQTVNDAKGLFNESINSGAALKALDTLAEITNRD